MTKTKKSVTNTSKKITLNKTKGIIKRFIARPGAYLALFVLATYGMRQMLRAVNETASTALTVLAIAALVYILFIED